MYRSHSVSNKNVYKLFYFVVGRAFMDADEKYIEDDEIKESDNPLYSSR